MKRNGKIARLPYEVREELNRRLRDGKGGPGLLRWLNELPECQDVLDEEFDSKPVTKQNLSEWRQGGYEDWVRKEEARQRVQVMMEKGGDLEKDAGGMAIADRLGTLLAAELAVEMEQLDSIKDPKERWARMKEIARELYRLRREDHHARKLRMAEEQYAKREKEAEKEKFIKLQQAMQDKQLVVSIQGGGVETWKWTDWEIRVRHDLPMPLWWTNPQTAEEWSKLMMPYWRETATNSPQSTAKGRGSGVEGTGPKSEVQGPKSKSSRSRSESRAVRAGRTKSDQKSGAVAPGPSESGSVTKESSEGNEGAPEGSPRSAQPKAPSSLRSAGAVQSQSGLGGAATEGEIAKSSAVGPGESKSV